MANGHFTIVSPGLQCTLQDLGRYKQSHLGITTGGPADKHAFTWANRLLKNEDNSTALELLCGGLTLVTNIHTTIAVTGANAPLKINDQDKNCWQSHHVQPGDEIAIGFATKGCRIYLGVAGGFQAKAQFGSCSTVIRETIGGIDGNLLSAGLRLPVAAGLPRNLYRLSSKHIPVYPSSLSVRVIVGYQASLFSNQQIAKFFASEYKVCSQCDRMGYRLTGPPIESSLSTLYSEGICLGAIQIPPDGYPIILAADRQTIGGYPKIGAALSLDLYRLMQCTQGARIRFEPITIEYAHNLLHLAHIKSNNTPLIEVDG